LLPEPRPGGEAGRKMPRAVAKFVAEWSADPTGILPNVARKEALDRALAAIPYLEAARDGRYDLELAIETALERLLLAWSYLEIAPRQAGEEAG
jgi:hypothetical protein